MTANHPSTPAAEPREKSVLFCPDCAHESHVAGDWIVRETHARREYECPICGAVVTTRPSAVLCSPPGRVAPSE